MFKSIELLFKPSDEIVQERMKSFDRQLDAIAKKQVARFARGNAAMQMGLVETQQELDAQIDSTIARRT